jgi:hypothetical protein
MESNTHDNADILLRLEEPFDPEEVRWRVASTTKDGRKGRVTPYADPRAYTDRLNEVVTASGWTRQYTVHTISPVTRVKRDKPIQTGKVLVTGAVTISRIGTHCGSGEEWADDENAMTSAEAQAFKRACSCFGLGRYFYSFPEIWVDLNEKGQPKELPNLPVWALPKKLRPSQTSQLSRQTDKPTPNASKTKGPLDARVTSRIEGFRQSLGGTLYRSILGMVAKVRSARDIPNQQVQRDVLSWMESGGRGIACIREIAAEIPETEFYAILHDAGVESLARIPNFDVLKKLVNEMKKVASHKSAA